MADRPIRTGLPPITVIRDAIRYQKTETPYWLDSDPYGTRRKAAAKAQAEADATPSITAPGGFCIPGDWKPYVLTRWTGLDELHARQRALNEHTRWTNRARRWWRSHWWPVVIEDLRRQLDDPDCL